MSKRYTKRRKKSQLRALLAVVVLVISFFGARYWAEQPSISLEDIPEYSGDPYVALNGNIPDFSEADLTLSEFER